jgi:hypothetical protein
MRTVLLGLLGLVLAVTVGLGVHLLTRGTISLPVVRLEPAPALAPPAATTNLTTTEHADTRSTPSTTSGSTQTDDDNSGRGRGRGGSGYDSGSNSGRGGGDD